MAQAQANVIRYRLSLYVSDTDALLIKTWYRFEEQAADVEERVCFMQRVPKATIPAFLKDGGVPRGKGNIKMMRNKDKMIYVGTIALHKQDAALLEMIEALDVNPHIRKEYIEDAVIDEHFKELTQAPASTSQGSTKKKAEKRLSRAASIASMDETESLDVSLNDEDLKEPSSVIAKYLDSAKHMWNIWSCCHFFG